MDIAVSAGGSTGAVMVNDTTNPTSTMHLALDTELPLSADELRDLFPRTVRPAVIRILWVVLVAHLIVFGAFALAYSRLAG